MSGIDEQKGIRLFQNACPCSNKTNLEYRIYSDNENCLAEVRWRIRRSKPIAYLYDKRTTWESVMNKYVYCQDCGREVVGPMRYQILDTFRRNTYYFSQVS